MSKNSNKQIYSTLTGWLETFKATPVGGVKPKAQFSKLDTYKDARGRN